MLDEQTEQDYDYFQEKAEEHDFLSDVVNGDNTFAGEIKTLLQRIEEESGIRGKNGALLEQFRDRVELMDELSSTYIDKDGAVRMAGDLSSYKSLGTMSKTSWLLAGIGVVLLFVPGGQVLDLCFAGAGYLGGSLFGEARKHPKDIKERAGLYFAAVHYAAEDIDTRIWRAFVIDDFYERPWRFERTYTSHLHDGEREVIDEYLHELLESGGINMSAHGLESYLAELKDAESFD